MEDIVFTMVFEYYDNFFVALKRILLVILMVFLCIMVVVLFKYVSKIGMINLVVVVLDNNLVMGRICLVNVKRIF